eukprot:gene5203-7241_t
MWDFNCNNPQTITNFEALLDKDVPTKGAWNDDYLSYAKQFNIVPCPTTHIQYLKNGEGKEILRITNIMVDPSSWKIMLLACAAIGTKISEIYIHNAFITPQQLIELTKTLERIGCCTVLTMQFLPVDINEDNFQTYLDAFKSILSDQTCLEYISFKGNRFCDNLIIQLAPLLSTNFRLTSLNLSENCLTDASALAIVNAIRLNSNYKNISLAKNNLSVSVFLHILTLLLGQAASPEDENQMKTSAKMITDKNKAIKDQNKKRKKSGLTEFSEIVSLVDFFHKIDGKLMITNKSLQTVDFSWNFCDNFDDQSLLQKLNDENSTEERSEKVVFIMRGILNQEQVVACNNKVVALSI